MPEQRAGWLIWRYRACDLANSSIRALIQPIYARDMNEKQTDRIEVSCFGSAKGSDLDGSVVGICIIYEVFRKAEQCSNAIRIAHIYDAPVAACLHVPEQFDRLSRRVPYHIKERIRDGFTCAVVVDFAPNSA